MEIIILLQTISHLQPKTTWRQLVLVAEAMLSMTGRVTMRGISRWTEKGGSYRTIQRFFGTTIVWPQLNFQLFAAHRYKQGEEVALAGDHTVVTKSGHETHGMDYFFSSMHSRAVKGLEFFSLSLVNVSRRESSPLLMKQTIRVKREKKEAEQEATSEKKDVVVRKVAKTRIVENLNYRLIYKRFKPIFSRF